MLEMIINCLYVGAGGFIGSVFRYLLGTIPLNNQEGFPFITLLINVTGALLIGFIAVYAAKNLDLNPQLLLFLRVGLCGGFTTFSAFSLESFILIQKGEVFIAGIYISLSVILCILAVFVGQMIAAK